jgi:hypothetical protein
MGKNKPIKLLKRACVEISMSLKFMETDLMQRMGVRNQIYSGNSGCREPFDRW